MELLLALLLLLPARSIIQVPCLQDFSTFTNIWETACSSPCHIACPGACYEQFSTELVTGTMFYSSTTPLCVAAVFEGAAPATGGSFSIRSAGVASHFTSSQSVVGELLFPALRSYSRSSNETQLSWFIEPYERVRFLKEPEDVVVHLGDFLSLTCLVNKRSRARVTWYNNGREVSWSPAVDCKAEECRVQRANKAHSGLWQCKASTEHGTLLSRYGRVTVAYLNKTFVYQPRDFSR